MVYQDERKENFPSVESIQPFDYSYVPTTARVAVYDDMKMAPRIFEIEPAPTPEFIEHLASTIDEQKNLLGGKIPYTAIREVTENFIHAQFSEIVVSLLDNGNTIRLENGIRMTVGKDGTLNVFWGDAVRAASTWME